MKIQNDGEYREALKTITGLWETEDLEEGSRLSKLIDAVEDYEDNVLCVMSEE